MRENSMTHTPTIGRIHNFPNNVVMVDGQPGCGKTMLSPILSSLERVELLNYLFELEWVCRLGALKKMDEDAVIAFIRLLVDLRTYDQSMGRNMNFRYRDLSSAFQSNAPLNYLMRLFGAGDEAVSAKIVEKQPILNLAVHDTTRTCGYLYKALGPRLTFIEMTRHPLYMLIQQFFNTERLYEDPRDIQIGFEHDGKQLPYWAEGWEEKFLGSNNMDRTIFGMEWMTKQARKSSEQLRSEYQENFFSIPFEIFVREPMAYLRDIADSLGTNCTSSTKRVLKRQNVPRQRVADGIPLAIYKRCGWTPPRGHLNEIEELNWRRRFAIDHGASPVALDVMEQLAADYEDHVGWP